MLSLNVTINGLQEVKKQLDSTGEVLKDFKPEMELIGDFLVDFFSNAVFETEGSILGENWEPLSDKYFEWKTKNYPGRGILERTGALRHGFEAIPTATYCIIRNGVPYGVHLEFGTERMPARVFLKLDQERAEIVRDMIIDSLNDRIKDAID